EVKDVLAKWFGVDLDDEYTINLRFEYSGSEILEYDFFIAPSNSPHEIDSYMVHSSSWARRLLGKNTNLPPTTADRKKQLSDKIASSLNNRLDASRLFPTPAGFPPKFKIDQASIDSCYAVELPKHGQHGEGTARNACYYDILVT